MSTGNIYLSGISLIVKRALQGRVSPLNFLLILGFFSSLVLLYISLHVQFFTISSDISEGSERRELLMDQNVRLTAVHNELTSPDRIIPIAKQFGMRAGSPDEIRRLALYKNREFYEKEAAGLTQVSVSSTRKDIRTIDTEGR
ncbi:MAG: hypothetical protein KAX38_09840 [Candidatus Krumholzibacteria bacterium]|nr:hypothetical protein [Candidatus Krumholzibacteria bacterium]